MVDYNYEAYARKSMTGDADDIVAPCNQKARDAPQNVRRLQVPPPRRRQE